VTEPRRSPLWQLTLARIRLFYREPSILFWTFLFPILLTVALGIAFRSRPPEPILVAVVAGPAAEGARAALAVRPDVEPRILEPDAARAALRTGRVSVVVEPGPPPVLRFDPTRPESRLAHLVVDDLLERAAGRKDLLAPREEPISEPGSRYVDFLIPGLLGMNIMSTGLWGIGYVIVENRQKKLLKRLAATPMRRSHFLLSFAVVRSLFLALEVPFLLGFGILTFAIPLRGSVGTLAVVVIAGAVAFAGIGLLVAARASNVQTVSGLINLVMMPMMLMSGVFFSSEHFPALLQPIVRVLPLTALNDAIRAVMNEGASLLAVAPQVALLAAVGAVSFGLALKWFRWV
jgi:ABC-2 type transport system permease protein